MTGNEKNKAMKAFGDLKYAEGWAESVFDVVFKLTDKIKSLENCRNTINNVELAANLTFGIELLDELRRDFVEDYNDTDERFIA